MHFLSPQAALIAVDICVHGLHNGIGDVTQVSACTKPTLSDSVSYGHRIGTAKGSWVAFPFRQDLQERAVKTGEGGFQSAHNGFAIWHTPKEVSSCRNDQIHVDMKIFDRLYK